MIEAVTAALETLQIIVAAAGAVLTGALGFLLGQRSTLARRDRYWRDRFESYLGLITAYTAFAEAAVDASHLPVDKSIEKVEPELGALFLAAQRARFVSTPRAGDAIQALLENLIPWYNILAHRPPGDSALRAWWDQNTILLGNFEAAARADLKLDALSKADWSPFLTLSRANARDMPDRT